MPALEPPTHCPCDSTAPGRVSRRACLAWLGSTPALATEPAKPLACFPASPIHEFRWKLLDLALTRAGHPQPLRAVPIEELSQRRSELLVESGELDVVAYSPSPEREALLRPVRIDMLRGILGYRLLLIRASDQARIAAMSLDEMRRKLVFGFHDQWADLAILQGNGLTVRTTSNYENLFKMLAAGRFDAFPRGLNEAMRELEQRHAEYPELAIERSKALFFPFPVYYWVRKDRVDLARRIEHGLRAALADGSFRRLFETYHAREIELMKQGGRQVLMLANKSLPADYAEPDTSWWWPDRRR